MDSDLNQNDNDVVLIQNQYNYSPSEDLLVETLNQKIYIGFDIKNEVEVIILLIKPFKKQTLTDNLVQFDDDDDDDQKQKLEPKNLFLEYQQLQNQKSEFLQNIIATIPSEGLQQYDTVILEWVEFGNIEKYLENSEFFDEKTALLVFKQICLATKQFHDLNIRHDNLNLSNVLISQNNFKISNISTNDNDIFRSPEFLQGYYDELGLHSDIWTLGIILHKLIHGVYPYNSQGDIITQIKMKNQQTSQNFNHIFPVQISNEVQFLLDSILEIDPSQRPQIDQILENSIIQNIRVDVPKKQINNFQPPYEKLSGKYIFHQNSRTVNDYDNYFTEDIYLGFDQKYNKLVRCKKQQYQLKKLINPQIKQLENFINSKVQPLIEVKEYITDENSKENNIYKIIAYSNQGNLNEYIEKKKLIQSEIQLNETQIDEALSDIVEAMEKLNDLNINLGSFCTQSLYVHTGKLLIGEPLISNDKAQKKLQEGKSQLDYFAPEYKANILQLNEDTPLTKIDIWSFGMVFCKLVYGDLPVFDQLYQPILPEGSRISKQNINLISKCLKIEPFERASWEELKKENMPFTFKDRIKSTQGDDSSKRYVRNNNLKNMQKSNFSIPDVDNSEQNLDSSNLNNTQTQFNTSFYKQNRKPKKKQIQEEIEDEDDISEIQEKKKKKKLSTNQNIETVENIKPQEDNEEEVENELEEKIFAKKYFKQKEQDRFLYQIKPIRLVKDKLLQILTVFIKLSLTVIFFYSVFFRDFLHNAIYFMFKRGDLQVVTFQIRNSDLIVTKEIQIITDNTVDLLDFESQGIVNVINKNNCFSNSFDESSEFAAMEVIQRFQTGSFMWWLLCGIIFMVMIIVIKVIQLYKVNFLTILHYQKKKDKELEGKNGFLVACLILTYLEFSFVYYSHFQLFSFFYYIQFDQCLGIKQVNNVDMIFDTTDYFLKDLNSEYFSKILCTIVLFLIVHFTSILYFIFQPMQNSQLFKNFLHLLRILSYIIGVWVVCRIGAFLAFQPTFSYDERGIIDAVFTKKGNDVGTFGFFPEIFELLLFILDILVEFIILRIFICRENRVKKIKEEKIKLQEQKDPFAKSRNKNQRLKNILNSQIGQTQVTYGNFK